MTAEPVGIVRIRVLPDGVEQSLLRAELLSDKTNSVVDEINATLGCVRLVNTVTSERGDDGRLRLVCQLVLDGSFSRGVLSKVPIDRLNGVMTWAVAQAMPWFIGQLARDYRLWSLDQPRNASMGAGEVGALARRLLTGGGRLPDGVEEFDVRGAAAGGIAQLPPSEADVGAVPSPTRGVGFGGRSK